MTPSHLTERTTLLKEKSVLVEHRHDPIAHIRGKNVEPWVFREFVETLVAVELLTVVPLKHRVRREVGDLSACEFSN